VKADAPSVQVTTGDPVKTQAGGDAQIRILKGARDPRRPNGTDTEALAFIEHKETMILVVLTARDSSTWDKDYAAFRHIVEGHKFFNCDSKDLAVPCKSR
jgi:hypothetical protein